MRLHDRAGLLNSSRQPPLKGKVLLHELALLALDADAVAVGAGFNHGAAVTADGRAHVWGKMQGAAPQEDRARAGRT